MSGHRVTVLLDTNVFIAAYWSPQSASARIIRACLNGKIQAQYTPEVRREVTRLLRQAQTSDGYVSSLEKFWARAQEVQGLLTACTTAEDPEDQKFLEAAVGGETDFLVTKDEHLLKIGFVGRTQILTPQRFVRLLS